MRALGEELGMRVYAALLAENRQGRELGSPRATIVTRAKRAQSMRFVSGWSQPNEWTRAEIEAFDLNHERKYD